MKSVSKNNILFLNVLLSLALSNSLTASENEIPNDLDLSDFSKSDDLLDSNKNINNNEDINNNEELELAEIIEQEELLLLKYSQQELLAEELFLEEIAIEQYTRAQMLAEEAFIDQLSSGHISNANSNDEPQLSNGKEILALSIDAIYKDDKSSKEKIVQALAIGNKKVRESSLSKILTLCEDAKCAVKNSLKTIKLKSAKLAGKNIATAIEIDHNQAITKQTNAVHRETLAQLLNLKKEVLTLKETHHDKNRTYQQSDRIQKATIDKLGNLTQLAMEIESEQVHKTSKIAQEIKKEISTEHDNLKKLASLKTLAAELSLEQLGQTSKEKNKNLPKNTYSASNSRSLDKYITKESIKLKPINTNHTKTDNKQNYLLVKSNSGPTNILTSSKQAKEIKEKISSGVRIGDRADTEAELEDVTSPIEIAPHIETIDLDPNATELLLVDSKMNKQNRSISTLVAFNQNNNEIFAPIETVKAWGVSGPYPETVDIQGQALIPLHKMHSIETKFDRANLFLDLSVPTDAFSKQVIDFTTAPKVGSPISNTGLYLNYDMLYTDAQDSSDSAQYNILLSPVIFSKYGFLSSRFRYVGQTNDDEPHLARIDTYFQRDMPNRMTSLRIGDIVTNSGSWGRNSAFTGLQYGTNFDTQPHFISRPLPYLFTETNAPSSVDVYVNDRLIRNVNVDPGPFEIRNIPPVNGNGQIQFVVKDELGRERIITSDFYTNRALLKPGVSDYSINLGVARENIGRSSTDYGSALAVADYRRGITDKLTLGTRAELSSDTKNIGISSDYTLGKLGRVSSSLAVSNNETSKSALLMRLGYNYANRRFNLATNYLKTDKDFRYIGQNTTVTLDSQFSLSGGLQFNQYGSLGASHVKQNLIDDVRTVNSLSYSVSLKGKYNISLFGSKAKSNLIGDDNLYYGFSFSTSLGNNGSIGSGWSKNGGQSRFATTYQKSSNAILSPSYRIRAEQYSDDPLATELDASTRTQYFDVDTRLSHRDEGLAHQLGVYGSFAYLQGGYWGFARDISDSFAVVKVGDFSDVGVYRDNKFIGRTNSRGYMIAPDLSPYLGNTLSFDPVDVPLDTTFITEDSEAVPYSNSGVFINFDIQRSTSYSFTALDTNGNVLPLGSHIQIGDDHSSIVGYDGMVFVQVPETIHSLKVGQGNRKCEIKLPSSGSSDPINGVINIDKLTCK